MTSGFGMFSSLISLRISSSLNLPWMPLRTRVFGRRFLGVNV